MKITDINGTVHTVTRKDMVWNVLYYYANSIPFECTGSFNLLIENSNKAEHIDVSGKEYLRIVNLLKTYFA